MDNEAELQRTHELGIAVGLEKAAGIIMDKAIQEFRFKGSTDLAKRYHSLSKELQEEADKAKPPLLAGGEFKNG